MTVKYFPFELDEWILFAIEFLFSLFTYDADLWSYLRVIDSLLHLNFSSKGLWLWLLDWKEAELWSKLILAFEMVFRFFIGVW